MSQATNISYKELQKEAKRCGIPANMKRAFLESAIEAFVEDNHEKLNTIVQYHKSQRKRRVVNKSVKTFATSTQQPSKKVKKLTDVVVTSPLQLQASSASDSSRECIYKPGDGDDDSSDFRPDSTSTPIRCCCSSKANLNNFPNDFGSQCVRTKDIRAPYNLSSHRLRCSLASTSASLPKIPARQKMVSDDKDELPSIHLTDRPPIVSSVVEQPFTPSQSIAYELDTNVANIHFATRQKYFPVQTADYYAETNVGAQAIRPENSSYMPGFIEKKVRSSSSSSSSSYHRSLDNVSNLNDTKRRFSSSKAAASCSLSVRPTFVDNPRTFAVNSAATSTSTSIDRARMTDIFEANFATDKTSINTEFDSDSSTETLSLTDEIVNLFDMRQENAMALPPFAATPCSNLSILAKSKASGSVFDGSDGQAATRITADRCGDCESERCDTRSISVDAASTTNSVTQPVHRSSNTMLDNIAAATVAAAAGYKSLPSISTLLPEYKIQAYRESSQRCYELTSLFGDYSHADLARGTATEFTPTPEKSNIHASSSSSWWWWSPSSSSSSSSSSPSTSASHARETSTVLNWSAASCKPLSVESSRAFSVPYLCANTIRSNDQVYAHVSPYSNLPHSEESYFSTAEASIASKSSSMISSSVSARLPVRVNFTTPFNEATAAAAAAAVQEMDNYQTDVVRRSDGLLYKMTADFTSNCEKILSSSSEQIFLKHEAIAIQGCLSDNCAKAEDVFCTEALELEASVPVEKSMTMSTVCRNSKIQAVEDDRNSSMFSYRWCENKAYGCDVVTTNDESAARVHEKECLYRVVGCPADECNWRGVLRTLTDHIFVDHKSNLNVGNDLVFVLDRNERGAGEERSVTYFQLLEETTTTIVITLHVHEQNCIATMRYLPEIETPDYDNDNDNGNERRRRLAGTMQLVYFADGGRIETKCWKGDVRPYFECQTSGGNTLQSTIGNSKNVVVRVLIDS